MSPKTQKQTFEWDGRTVHCFGRTEANGVSWIQCTWKTETAEQDLKEVEHAIRDAIIRLSAQ